MTMRVCLDCSDLTTKSRCERCAREHDRARGTRQRRGYDADYDQRRRDDLARMARGEVLTCWRCERVVLPHEYSLGHCDDDRSIVHGAEHLAENVAHTRGGCPHPEHANNS